MQQGHWAQEHMTAASECTRPAKIKPARTPTQELPLLAEELLGTDGCRKRELIFFRDAVSNGLAMLQWVTRLNF